MHQGTCKQCGAAFWESSKGARGEDLCDNCENPVGKIVAYRHEAKPFNHLPEAQAALTKWLQGQPAGRWNFDQLEVDDEGVKIALRHIYGGTPQWLSNERDE